MNPSVDSRLSCFWLTLFVTRALRGSSYQEFTSCSHLTILVRHGLVLQCLRACIYALDSRGEFMRKDVQLCQSTKRNSTGSFGGSQDTEMRTQLHRNHHGHNLCHHFLLYVLSLLLLVLLMIIIRSISARSELTWRPAGFTTKQSWLLLVAIEKTTMFVTTL